MPTLTREQVTIFDPTVPVTVEHTDLARRLDSLEGKTIGLFDNTKLNAVRLLELVGEQLSERYHVKSFVRGQYQTARGMRREEWIGIEACDAIILTNGD